MAELNFNALARPGPRGFAQGFEQGQQERQANMLATQKQAQEQDLNALRMQQTRGAIEQQEFTRQKQVRAEKVTLFRDRLARAPTPDAAREVVRMQYADPDLGPLAAQTGSLEQALAEVSDDPTQFEQYKQREIMGAAEWLKSQMPKVAGNAVYDPRTNSFITAPREPAPVAPSAPVAVMGPDGRPQYVSREQAIGMTPFTPATVKIMGGGSSVAGGGRAAPAGKAPPGYRFTPTGDLEAIPGGPAATNLAPKDVQKREATYLKQLRPSKVLKPSRRRLSTISSRCAITRACRKSQVSLLAVCLV